MKGSVFEVAGMHEGWNKAIEQHFSRRKVHKSTQLIYKWRDREAAKFATAESPVRVERLTDDWLGSGRITNLDFVESELRGFWGGLNPFLQHGVAYCAMQKDTIASICYSGFVGGSTHTLGVKTFDSFRQRGLRIELLKHASRN